MYWSDFLKQKREHLYSYINLDGSRYLIYSPTCHCCCFILIDFYILNINGIAIIENFAVQITDYQFYFACFIGSTQNPLNIIAFFLIKSLAIIRTWVAGDSSLTLTIRIIIIDKNYYFKNNNNYFFFSQYFIEN